MDPSIPNTPVSAPSDAAPAAPRASIADLVSPNALGSVGDVATTRERRRVVRGKISVLAPRCLSAEPDHHLGTGEPLA